MLRRRSGRRLSRRGIRRLVLLGVVCLLALLYYRPVRAYVETSKTLEARKAEVRGLQAERRSLERRLELTESGATLLRAARRLGYVKPGERLFIVKGIPEWRRAHARRSR